MKRDQHVRIEDRTEKRRDSDSDRADLPAEVIEFRGGLIDGIKQFARFLIEDFALFG